MTLYIIQTDALGRVNDAVACPDGIDQAIDMIAGSVTKPEEDPAVSYDVISALWETAVADGERLNVAAVKLFTVKRREHPIQYGLIVIEEVEG